MKNKEAKIKMGILFSACLLVSVFFIFFTPRVSHDEDIGVSVETIAEDDHFAWGQYYFNHGDRADGTYDLLQARTYYEQAIAVDPFGNELAWHQLGRIDFLEGKFDNAIITFHRQIEHFGDTIPNVYYMLGLTYGYMARDTGDVIAWEKAEAHFIKYLEYDPTSPWARVDLSWVLFAQGKYAEMLPILEIAIEDSPDNPWVLNMYGLALLNTEQKETAHEYFLLARDGAKKLSVEEWGKSYPGNDPGIWGRGLGEFRSIIERNIELTQ